MTRNVAPNADPRRVRNSVLTVREAATLTTGRGDPRSARPVTVPGGKTKREEPMSHHGTLRPIARQGAAVHLGRKQVSNVAEFLSLPCGKSAGSRTLVSNDNDGQTHQGGEE